MKRIKNLLDEDIVLGIAVSLVCNIFLLLAVIL
jgi:hypothetical protein